MLLNTCSNTMGICIGFFCVNEYNILLFFTLILIWLFINKIISKRVHQTFFIKGLLGIRYASKCNHIPARDIFYGISPIAVTQLMSLSYHEKKQ